MYYLCTILSYCSIVSRAMLILSPDFDQQWLIESGVLSCYRLTYHLIINKPLGQGWCQLSIRSLAPPPLSLLTGFIFYQLLLFLGLSQHISAFWQFIKFCDYYLAPQVLGWNKFNDGSLELTNIVVFELCDSKQSFILFQADISSQTHKTIQINAPDVGIVMMVVHRKTWNLLKQFFWF